MIDTLEVDGSVRRWAIGLFAAALVVALMTVFGVFHAQTLVENGLDPYYFGEMGKSLARGDGLDSYGTLLKRRSPGYPLVLGGIFILFGERIWVVQLLQCLMFAATCVLTFDMGRRVFNLRTGLVAAAMCALHPLLLRYVPVQHLETLLTFLFTLTIWCTVRFYERPNVAHGVALGAAGAAAALTKAVVVLYPALFIAVLTGLRLLPPRRRAPPTLVVISAVALTMTMCILPWTLRNYRATNGRFVLISSGFNDAFLRGYVFSKPDYALLRKSPYVDAENESNAWFQTIVGRAGSVWERDDYETEQILGQEVRAKLRTQPAEFVRKVATGLFTFWYEMTSLTNSLLVGILALAAWLLALAGAGRARAEQRPLWLFLLPALHLNVLLAILLALGRYSVPIIPALLVGSAFGVDTILQRFSRPASLVSRGASRVV